jgi:hypothetical protein
MTQEQLAAAMAVSWPVEPAYRITQPADPVRAWETWRRCVAAYIYGRRAAS